MSITIKRKAGGEKRVPYGSLPFGTVWRFPASSQIDPCDMGLWFKTVRGDIDLAHGVGDPAEGPGVLVVVVPCTLTED